MDQQTVMDEAQLVIDSWRLSGTWPPALSLAVGKGRAAESVSPVAIGMLIERHVNTSGLWRDYLGADML